MQIPVPEIDLHVEEAAGSQALLAPGWQMSAQYLDPVELERAHWAWALNPVGASGHEDVQEGVQIAPLTPVMVMLTSPDEQEVV